MRSAAFGGGPIEFRGAYRTGALAIERAGWGDVDVAVIDDSLPDLDTIGCRQRLGQLAPHVHALLRKLEVATRSELVARCASAFAAPEDGSPVQSYPGTDSFEI